MTTEHIIIAAVVGTTIMIGVNAYLRIIGDLLCL